MRPYHLYPKTAPKWWQLRRWVAALLVKIARWVEPDSEEVKAFVNQQIMDYMIYGKSIIRVAPEDELLKPV